MKKSNSSNKYWTEKCYSRKYNSNVRRGSRAIKKLNRVSRAQFIAQEIDGFIIKQ